MNRSDWSRPICANIAICGATLSSNVGCMYDCIVDARGWVAPSLKRYASESLR